MKRLNGILKRAGICFFVLGCLCVRAYGVWVPDAWDVYPEEFHKIYDISSKYVTDEMDLSRLTIKDFKGKSYEPSEALAEGMDLKSLALKFKEDSKNDDVVGWIYVPKTNINYPIVQHESNTSYYVDRNYEKFQNPKKDYGFPGVIWVDSFCNFKKLADFSPNTVFNGHNWENYKGQPTYPEGPKLDDHLDIMFSQFHSYLDYSYAKERPYIYVSTLDENIVLKIFAVFCTEDSFRYFDVGFDTDARLAMLQDVMSRTIYDYDCELRLDEKVFTFSTCTRAYGKGREDQRFVIMARPLRANESVDDEIEVKVRTDYKKPNMKQK